MKYILTSYFIMIASMLYSLTNSLVSNVANQPTQPTVKYRAADNDNLINFKENKLLVAEYSNMTKDKIDGLKTVPEEKGRRDVKRRVVVN